MALRNWGHDRKAAAKPRADATRGKDVMRYSTAHAVTGGRRGARGLSLLLASAVPFSAATQQAFAQQALPPAPQAAPVAGTTTQHIEEVVVTAQKRSQRLQDVPIAVTAISSAQLAKRVITKTDDLTQVTPGLTYSQSAIFAQPVVRGIGSSSTGLGDESNVATYIDGVYMSRMLGNFYELTGIQSVEVLKGPQGTLFGRNATGGAISINTLAPSSTPGGEFSVGYGSYNDVVTKGYLTGPIAPDLAGNISGYYERRDGFYTNLTENGDKTNNLNTGAVRAKLAYTPDSPLSITAEFDYEKSNDATGVESHPLNGNSIGILLGAPNPSGYYDVAANLRPTNDVEQYGGYLKAAYDFGFARLISISSARRTTDLIQDDPDSTAAPVFQFVDTELSTTVQQEFQLVSVGHGPLTWILGAYYYHDSAQYAPLLEIAGGQTVASVTADLFTDALAGYADATYAITDQVSLTGGVRYSSEHKNYSAANAGFPVIDDDNKTFQDFTPRAVLSYKPVENLMLYVSYSKGFKSGEFNPSAFQVQPVAPEKIQAYEIGIKSQLFNRLTLNASAFYYDYTNLQLQVLEAGTGTAILENAASAHIHGADLEATLAVTDGLNTNLGISYLSGHYSSFPDASVTIPTGVGGNIQVSRDVSGYDIERAPKWTANFGADYTIDMDSRGSLLFSGNGYYSTNYYWDPLNRISQGNHFIANLQAQYRLPGNRWTISVYGKNITDARFYTTVETSSLGDSVVFHDPATVGVTVDYKF
jgi:iron complex outermembrane recepter protein